MTPISIELVKTLHEDQRRRLTRRTNTDDRFARPKRRRPRI
jgi:hypothetical protein